jgi:hypothetical protein
LTTFSNVSIETDQQRAVVRRRKDADVDRQQQEVDDVDRGVAGTVDGDARTQILDAVAHSRWVSPAGTEAR